MKKAAVWLVCVLLASFAWAKDKPEVTLVVGSRPSGYSIVCAGEEAVAARLTFLPNGGSVWLEQVAIRLLPDALPSDVAGAVLCDSAGNSVSDDTGPWTESRSTVKLSPPVFLPEGEETELVVKVKMGVLAPATPAELIVVVHDNDAPFGRATRAVIAGQGNKKVVGVGATESDGVGLFRAVPIVKPVSAPADHLIRGWNYLMPFSVTASCGPLTLRKVSFLVEAEAGTMFFRLDVLGEIYSPSGVFLSGDAVMVEFILPPITVSEGQELQLSFKGVVQEFVGSPVVTTTLLGDENPPEAVIGPVGQDVHFLWSPAEEAGLADDVWASGFGVGLGLTRTLTE